SLNLNRLPPLRSVHGRSAELVEPLYVRDRRSIELTYRADDGVERFRVSVAVLVFDQQLPRRMLSVISARYHCRLQANVRTKSEFGGTVLNIVVDFFATYKVPGPVGLLCERVGVNIARGIDAAAGVSILRPRARTSTAAFKQRDTVTGIQSFAANRDPGHACTDDSYMARGTGRTMRHSLCGFQKLGLVQQHHTFVVV